MDRFSEAKIKCLKSGSKWAYLVQNFSLIIFMKSILVILVPPTHKLAKTVEKSPKIALLWGHFPRNWDRNRKIGSNDTIRSSF